MKLLMSDYEVTLVNDNMQVSCCQAFWAVARRDGGRGGIREEGDKGDEQVSEWARAERQQSRAILSSSSYPVVVLAVESKEEKSSFVCHHDDSKGLPTQADEL